MIGERIRQARLLAGLTQEALAIAITDAGHPATKAVISKYENAKSTPSAQFLLLAANILDVPASYFTHEPILDVTWSGFRRHSTLPNRDQEAVKTYAANVAELQIELQTLLHPDSEPALPEVIVVDSFEGAEQAAMLLREFWELDEHPIDSLVQTAEDHQIVVVGWRKHVGEFVGLSGWCNQKYPVTVISMIAEADRRRFTLAHELGHLVMDTEAVSDKEAERFAHRFAAALIVPAKRAFHELGTRRTRLDLEELGILKRKYGLSIAAWIYRAKDLEIITDNHASNLYRELSQRGWRKQEPIDYIGDEEPLKLDQMAHHAVAEGLISPDQIRRVYPDWLEREVSQSSAGRFTVYDLLDLPEEERQRALEEAYALAGDEEFETFEANEFREEDEGMA
jgi:Zn-dependent peptidase ImmA (M78 family)